MSTPTETVKTFLAMWEAPGGIEKAIRSYFNDDTTWENVGMSTTTGPEEAIAVMDGFGMKAMWVKTLRLRQWAAQY
ncbi:MAG: hypothetical protein KUG65_09685 [Sphingomonadaceae bacterium]|nr:hypothetical protein [Sphingomonadaceae bacterium]